MNLIDYTDFVKSVTSEESEEVNALVERLYDLEISNGVNISLLLTGAMGLSSEAGEFTEVVKKTIFQGKPLDLFHLKRELGDILWYWVNAVRAIGLTPEQVINENLNKIRKRYPQGFNIEHSENRVEGDL